MSNIDKSFSILLILIIVISSLLMVESALAQSIPTPSVPEFTVKQVVNYYSSTNSTFTDQYGNTITKQGYERSIEFSIKNQPFTAYTIPYNSSDPYNTGQTVNFMFNIRMKMHFENDSYWQYITHLSDGFLKQSDSNPTIASYQIENLFPIGVPNGEQIDFQVQALIGYVHRYPVINSWTFNGTESDWSNTQTITLPEIVATPNPTVLSTSTPTVPELSWLIIVPLLLSVFPVAVVVRHRKTA